MGPIIGAQIIGYTGDVGRFANRDPFASYNGAAPIEWSSGGRVVHRLSRRGNRRLNHAIHMAAICQIRQSGSAGKVEDLATRFERLVDRTGEHHLWLGSVNPDRGTGRMKVDKVEMTAHRVAWELAHGGLRPTQRVLTCETNRPASVSTTSA